MTIDGIFIEGAIAGGEDEGQGACSTGEFYADARQACEASYGLEEQDQQYYFGARDQSEV